MTRCDCGPSLRIGWPLPCSQPQVIDDPRAEQEHEDERGDHRAAGAERDVAEHVERGRTCQRTRKANKAWSTSGDLDVPRARLAAIAALQRLDDRTHAGAERSLDHDGVAAANGGEHLRLERGGGLGIAAPAARREAPPTGRASAARSRTPDRRRARPPARPSPRCSSAPLRPELEHVARAPRCAGRAGRPPPARAARAPPASRPDWRCSSRRSAARRRPAARASRARRARSRAADRASASAASARSAPASTEAASTASELSTTCRPGAPSL